jgi:RNA polymerase sigma factor (sigma-70 family)
VTPANDNVERPAEFDARVMRYWPGLWNLAGELGARGEERQDLVTETVMEALKKWENYREGGGFYKWLYWMMRGIWSNSQRSKMRSPMTDLPVEEYEQRLVTQPTQEHYVELSQALSRMTAGRRGNVLVRRAMGESLREIGADIGVGPEGVRQLELRERKMLQARVG